MTNVIGRGIGKEVGAFPETGGEPLLNISVKSLSSNNLFTPGNEPGIISVFAGSMDAKFQLSSPGYKPIIFTIGDIIGTGEGPYFFSMEKDTTQNVMPLAIGAGIIFLLAKKKEQKKQVGKIETKEVLLIGGGLIAFSVLQKILQGVGLWKSQETKNLDQETTNPNSFWSPNYYKMYSSYSYAIDRKTAESYAKEIYNAFGMFNDCEECVKAVFRRLRTKSNVSYLVQVFSDVYGQDLLTFLRGGIWPQDRLSDSDVNEINSFLSKLPTN